MNKFIGILTALVLSFSTQATLISVELDKADYQVGDTLVAQFIISDIEYDSIGFQRLLAEFIFDTDFDSLDTNLLELSSVSFGDKLDVDPDPLYASEQYFDLVSPGILNISEISFAFYDDLFTAQDGLTSFLIASANFKVTGAGFGSFNLSSLNLTDDLGNDFTDINSQGANFSSTAVPEPASILLVLMALGFMVTRKKA